MIMAKIWIFDLENILKNSTIKVSEDNTIYLYNIHNYLLAIISNDVYATSTIQLKLNSKELELIKNKLKEII